MMLKSTMAADTAIEKTRMPDRQTMLRAFTTRDTDYEGIFIAAIKTTGIFCRPGCRARTPKHKNIEFFPGSQEAIAAGYRPCKLCKPTEAMHTRPAWVKNVLERLIQDPETPLADADLRKENIDPVLLRRWCKQHLGCTFQEYRRSLRLEMAARNIKSEKVIDAAFGSGYESLSGFSSAFKNAIGVAPVKSRAIKVLRYSQFDTELGPMVVCESERGICLLEFHDRKAIEAQFKRLQTLMNAKILHGHSEMLNLLEKEITEYFRTGRQSFTVPIDIAGTGFQKQVWKQLANIPYGETRSYADIARALNKPTASRAVARANASNRLAVLIPCHRVIGQNGALSGYAGGVWRKQRLLELERKNTMNRL